MFVVLEFIQNMEGMYTLVKKSPESVPQFKLGRNYQTILIQAEAWGWEEVAAHVDYPFVEGTGYTMLVLAKKPEPAPKPLPWWKRVLRRRR